MYKFCLCLLSMFASLQGYAANVYVTVGDGGNYFSPANFTINPGDTVTWVWINGHHNTSCYSMPAGAAGWYSNIDVSTDTFSTILSVSGLYKYTCTHHSGMDGQFFVTGCSYPAKPVITGGTSACIGDTIVLHTQQQPDITYQWLNGSVSIPGTGDSMSITASGNYKVLVNRCGVDSVSDLFPVTIHPLPVVGFTYTSSGNDYTFSNATVQLNHSFVWSFGDGSPVATSFNANHIYTAQGTYEVVLQALDTVTGCSNADTQKVQVVINTGTTKTSMIHKLYPNPATDYLYIKAVKGTLIQLIDVYGHVLYRGIILNEEESINIAAYSPGIYYLKLQQDDHLAAERISILH